MPFDGIALHAVINELKEKLIGAKVQKVYQPSKDEVLISFSDYDKSSVLLCADASYPRVHLTDIKYDNPEYPPSFCMVLRKYLVGGIVKDISQHSFDRVAVFDIESLDEAGNLMKISLIAEFMGKHSNIILIQKSSDKIIDAVKHISGLKSSVRRVMPNFDYTFPPNEKLNPCDFDALTAQGLLSFYTEKNVESALLEVFCGVSKQLAHSFATDRGFVGIKIETLSQEIFSKLSKDFSDYFKDKLSEKKAYIYRQENGANKDFSFSLYSALSEYKTVEFQSISEAIDSFYMGKTLTDNVKQRYDGLIKNLSLLYEREIKKLNVRKKELEESKEADVFITCGNLLLANLHAINKGDTLVKLTDYYSEEQNSIEIKLKPEYSATQNAQMYFKKYTKAKSAIEHLNTLIAQGEEKKEFLSQQLYYLTRAENTLEAEDVLEELIKAGYVKRNKKKQQTKPTDNNFYRYFSTDGYEILAGKNSKQNNYLTFKAASKDDIWLHAKDIPASHVILKTKNAFFSEQALAEAAQVAVYHSKARDEKKIAVDYTFVKNVKKIPASSYGNVTFTDNKTVYITVDQKLIGEILQKEQE